MPARIALAFALLVVVSGLSLERQPSEESSSKLAKLSSSKQDGFWFGAEAEKAAVAAKAAEEVAKKTEAEVGLDISERELDAATHLANVEAGKEYSEEQKVDAVVDSMAQEANAEDRAVDDVFRKMKRQQKDEERRAKQMDRELQKMERQADIDDDLEYGKKSKKEKMEEKEKAAEERKERNDLREAQRAVATIKQKEKAYQKRRQELEKTDAKRLWNEADRLRLEALEAMEANGTLSEDDIVQFLDVSKATLANLTKQITDISHHDPGANVEYQDRIETIRQRASVAAAHLLEAIKHKTEGFVSAQAEYDDRQVLVALSKYFTEVKNEVRILQNTSTNIWNRIQAWDVVNPEKLSSALSLALDGVTGNTEFKHKLLGIETERLMNLNTTQAACELLTSMLPSEMQPAYMSLMHMKQHLDSMAKVVPSILKSLPYNVTGLMDRPSTILVNMAYTEYAALKDAAAVLTTDAAPVILKRLRCTLEESAAAHQSAGLAAVLFAAWLALF